MKLSKVIALPAIALTAGLGLAACGSAKAPAAAPAVTHAVTAQTAAPKPTSPEPTTPAPAPAETVSVPVTPAVPAVPAVPAAPAVPWYIPAVTDCGGGVAAGADTSCSFALNVAASYTGAGADYAYSPVTGLNYTMTCNGGEGALDTVTCTGGDNALVDFQG